MKKLSSSLYKWAKEISDKRSTARSASSATYSASGATWKLLLAGALTFALIAPCPLASFAAEDLEKDPAYLPIDKVLDLKTIHPEVNVNLPRFLLKDVASGFDGGTNDPLAGTGIDLQDLVKDVKLIRVVVIEGNQTNRAALDKGMKALKGTLEAKWMPVVTVPDDNVGIYAMGDPSGESMAGLAVLVYEKGDDAVIVNIVGHVSIGKLIKIASSSGKLPKGMLEKLRAIGDQTGEAVAKPASKDADRNAKKQAEDSEGTSKKTESK